MKILFFSDLHISSDLDPLYQAFLEVLKGSFQPGDRVVLAGDIFDLWVGNKETFKNRYREFLGVLENLSSQNVMVDYIEGNHDFYLQDVFFSIPHVLVHKEKVAFEIEGKFFFVAHGDLANSQDYSYLALRMAFRSMPIGMLVKTLPGQWIDQMGKWSGRVSKLLRRQKDNVAQPAENFGNDYLKDLRVQYHAYARAQFLKGYDYVVLGHCHDFDTIQFESNGKFFHYHNMGLPRFHKHYLIWKSGDEDLSRVLLPKF